MASIVGTASQYKQFASQTHKNEWEDVLAGLKSNLETEQTALQTARDYDISGAYANYLQQQRAINQSNALFKSPYQTMAQKQYQSNYAAAQSEYASAFNKLQAGYASDVASATTQYEKLLTKEAENYQAIYSDLINQLKTSSGITDDAYLYGIEGGLGYLQETQDEEGRVFVDLTEKGKAALSDYLYGSETRNWDTKDTSKQERYIDYLARTNPDAYEFLISNTENINKNLLQQPEGWSYDKAIEEGNGGPSKNLQQITAEKELLQNAEDVNYSTDINVVYGVNVPEQNVKKVDDKTLIDTNNLNASDIEKLKDSGFELINNTLVIDDEQKKEPTKKNVNEIQIIDDNKNAGNTQLYTDSEKQTIQSGISSNNKSNISKNVASVIGIKDYNVTPKKIGKNWQVTIAASANLSENQRAKLIALGFTEVNIVLVSGKKQYIFEYKQ